MGQHVFDPAQDPPVDLTTHRSLALENLALRQQLAILQRFKLYATISNILDSRFPTP